MEEKLFEAFEPVSRQQWQEKIITDLKGKDYAGLHWQAAGLKGEPIFTKEDLPGQIPNLANVHPQPELFGDRHWINYQWVRVDDEKTANKTALHALNNGAEGIVFELSRNPNWNDLLKDIGLEYCHLGLVDLSTEDTGIFNSFQEHAAAAGINQENLHGFVNGQNEKVGKGPIKTLNIQAREAYAHGLPALELACVLAQAAELYDRLTDAGSAAGDLLHQTQFQLSMGDSYFAEIAKYRAMRGLALHFAAAYDVALKANEVQILAMSSDWVSAQDDPHSHMLHATTQGMSAIIGGADALCIKPFYPIFDNKDLAERTARNISSILREESYLAKVVDPSAGTYYIESLTQQLHHQAWQLFVAIEEAGGITTMDAEQLKSLHQKSSS